MKNILLFTIVVCTLVFVNTSIFKTNDKIASFVLANVEALAEKETVEDCNIFLYNRNEAEKTDQGIVQTKMFGGLYVVIDGVEIELGLSAKAGGSVKIYSCKESLGNCCAKSWMTKPVEYL